MEKKDLEAFTAHVLEHAKAAAKRQGVRPDLCADDTLGRIIQYCAPWIRQWGRRFARTYGALGIVLLPLKVYSLHDRSGLPWEQLGGWLNTHEPLFLIKVLVATGVLAFMIVFMWLAFATDFERARRKRRLKGAEAGP